MGQLELHILYLFIILSQIVYELTPELHLLRNIPLPINIITKFSF